jgi:two-component sensor histidine kinase
VVGLANHTLLIGKHGRQRAIDDSAAPIRGVVQSLVMRTLSDQRSTAEARDVLLERVHALGRVQELLMRTDWRGAPIKDIVAAELEPFGERVRMSGPPLVVDGKMVQTLALVLQELATNAVKHGSLSDGRGSVSINWSVSGQGADARFKFGWEERDGPRVQPPSRKGFGSTLLETAITSDLSIEPHLSFEADGFVYELEAPLGAIVQTFDASLWPSSSDAVHAPEAPSGRSAGQ